MCYYYTSVRKSNKNTRKENIKFDLVCGRIHIIRGSNSNGLIAPRTDLHICRVGTLAAHFKNEKCCDSAAYHKQDDHDDHRDNACGCTGVATLFASLFVSANFAVRFTKGLRVAVST